MGQTTGIRWTEATANPVMEPGPITWPCTAHHGADPSEWPETLRVQEFPARRPA